MGAHNGNLLQVRSPACLCAPSAASVALCDLSAASCSPGRLRIAPNSAWFNCCRCRRRRLERPSATATPLPQSAARRRALLLTLALLTACYTWSSVRRLADLTQVEPELPAGAAAGGLLQRAEANIASHLHGAASKWAVHDREVPVELLDNAYQDSWWRAACSACRTRPFGTLAPTCRHALVAAAFRGAVTGGAAGGAGAQQQQPIVLKQQQQQQEGAAGSSTGGGGTAAGGTAAGGKARPAVDPSKCNMKKNTE